MSLIVPALAFKQGKQQMYIAAVPSRYLERFSIDTWNPKSVVGQRGYQRNPDEKRVKSIAKYFEQKNAIMPVAGLLNVRERGRLRYRRASSELVIPDGTNVWVVDMQHRLRGLVQAIDDGTVDPDRFGFPVVITEGLSKVDEAAQFYIINTKAKRMDVALTRRLLIENARINDIADVRPWEIPAVQITIELNTNLQSPWHNRLRQPNEERAGHHIATETSFAKSSLRQLLITKRYGSAKKLSRRLIAFWSAIRDVLPEAFHEPRRYLLQKTPGMFAFNFFLAPRILARTQDKDFARRLSGLGTLGPDFWKRTNKRGARRFGSGMGGYSNLAEHLRKYVG